MAYEFKLPDIGEGVVEGEIVEWHVAAGDTVTEDQPLVAIMTDKATVDIPSPKAGKVVSIAGKPGEIVKVGSVLVTIDAGGGAGKPAAAPATSAPAAKAEPPKAAAPATPAAPARPSPAPASAKPASAQAPAPPAALPVAAVPAAVPAAAPAGAQAAAPAKAPSSDGAAGVLASPATRRLAREMGVDLAAAQGTGPRGRVTAEDVQRAADAPRAAPVAARTGSQVSAPATAKGPAQPLLAIPRRYRGETDHEEERVALRGLRKRIAEKMVESKQRVPHFTYVEECDVTELVQLRLRLKPMAERYGVNLTFLPIIMKALVPCLREFPLVNASLDDETSELVLKKYYSICIATDTDRGLTVPVIADVDRKSVLEIAAEMTELTERARAGRSKLEDLQGGTFTITSTGNIGGLFATPIINHPEVAILGVPKIRQRPVVRDGQIVVRDILWLAISLDHRVVDGAVGARFLARLIEYLEDPGKIFLELA